MTRKSFFRSKPGKYLLIATLLIVVVTILFPFTPLAELLGFQPLPMTILLVTGMIVVLDIISGSLIVNDVSCIPTQEGKTLDSIQLTILIKMEPKSAPQKPLT